MKRCIVGGGGDTPLSPKPRLPDEIVFSILLSQNDNPYVIKHIQDYNTMRDIMTISRQNFAKIKQFFQKEVVYIHANIMATMSTVVIMLFKSLKEATFPLPMEYGDDELEELRRIFQNTRTYTQYPTTCTTSMCHIITEIQMNNFSNITKLHVVFGMWGSPIQQWVRLPNLKNLKITYESYRNYFPCVVLDHHLLPGLETFEMKSGPPFNTDYFSNLTNLTKLTLNDMYYHGNYDTILARMTKLEVLKICVNSQGGRIMVSNDAINGLINLRTLVIDTHNTINDDGILSLTKLEHMFLKGSTITDNSIERMCHLKTLCLQNCSFDCGCALPKLKNLTHLELSDCTHISYIGHLPTLKYLLIKNVHIDLAHLTNLEELNVVGYGMDDTNFRKLISLKYLGIIENESFLVNPLENLTNLTNLTGLSINTFRYPVDHPLYTKSAHRFNFNTLTYYNCRNNRFYF
jgi:hypothetical protein